MATYNIPETEARLRITLQEDVAALARTVRAEGDSAFGGIWIEHEPIFKIVVGFSDQKDRKALRDQISPKLRRYVQIKNVARSEAVISGQLDTLVAAILAARAASDASRAVRNVTSVERAYLRAVIKRTSRKNGPRWIVAVVNHGTSPGEDVSYLFVTDPDEIASWKTGKRTEKDFAQLASMIARGDDREIALPFHQVGALLCVAYTDVFDNRRIAWTEMSCSVDGQWNDTEHGENRAQSA